MAAFIHEYMTVILIVLFLGILFWAFRPKNRKRFQKDAEIPLHDDEELPR